MIRYYVITKGLFDIRQFIWSYPKGIAHQVGTNNIQNSFEEDEAKFINRNSTHRVPLLFLTLTGTANIYA